jgi:hypothetical protein
VDRFQEGIVTILPHSLMPELRISEMSLLYKFTCEG